VVVDGVVYIGAENGTLYAVDAATGEGVWEFEGRGGFFSSPAVYHDTLYVGSQGANLYAIDLATGEARWEV
jgi:outer membrane protein assembly factor BamB